MATTLAQVKAAQPQWFSRGNKRLFGDRFYRVLQGRVSRKPYLVRATYAWTDMFGSPRKLHYRVNELKEDLTIGNLSDTIFRSMEEVKNWLAGN